MRENTAGEENPHSAAKLVTEDTLFVQSCVAARSSRSLHMKQNSVSPVIAANILWKWYCENPATPASSESVKSSFRFLSI